MIAERKGRLSVYAQQPMKKGDVLWWQYTEAYWINQRQRYEQKSYRHVCGPLWVWEQEQGGRV